MADEVLGSLAVEITGDYSELQNSINSAVGVAEAGTSKISDAFAVPDLTSGMEASLGSLVDQILAAGNAADTASGQMALFGSDTTTALSDVNQQLSLFDTNGIEATDTAFGSLAQSADAAVAPIQEAASASTEASTGLAAMAEQLTLLGEALVITEGLKEFGQEALTAYGTVQSVTIGLTALTGSAEQADQIITQIRDLASTEPFAFPEIAPTVQKMVALGVSTDQVGKVMQAAADASAATGNGFSQVANALDRMSLSGTASSRILASLGISTQDLGTAMGVTAGEATAAFKALDQSERIDVLASALSKFAGTAEAEARGIAGQWQIFKNEFEETMVGIGESLAPAVGHILDFGKNVLGVVNAAVQGFAALPAPVQDVAIALGLIAAAAVPVTAGLAAIGLAATGLEAIPAIFASLTTAIGLTAAADDTLAVSAGTATVALEDEGAAAVTTAGEMDTAAAAAGVGGAGLTGALTGLRAVAAPLAALFAGWSFGVWAADVKSAGQQLQEMSGYARDLGLKFDQTSASGDEFGKSLTKLETEAAAEGIAVDRAGKTTQEYALALLTAMKNADDATTAEYNLAHGITTADDATKQHELSATQLSQKLSELKQNLFDANTALIEVGTAHRNDADYAQLHAAAVAQVSAAQKALGSALGITTASLKAHKDTLDAVDQSSKKITDDYLTATATWMKVKQQYDDGTASLVQLGIASENSDKAAAAYAKSIQAAGDQSHTAAAKVDDLATIIENGKSVLVPYADALNSAAKSTGDLTQATSDEYQAFVNGDEAASTLTDGITQLRGAVDTQKSSVDASGQSWIFQNGQWETGAQAIKDLKPQVEGLTGDMQALAKATSDAAAAQTALDSAQSGGKSGKASKGGSSPDGGLTGMSPQEVGQALAQWINSPDAFQSGFLIGNLPGQGATPGGGVGGVSFGLGPQQGPGFLAYDPRAAAYNAPTGTRDTTGPAAGTVGASLIAKQAGERTGSDINASFVSGSTAMATISINGSGPLTVDQATADSIMRAAQAGASAAQQWGILEGQNSLGDVLANTATTSGSAVAVIPEGMSTVSINGSAPMLVSSSVAQQMQEAAAAGASAAQQFGLLTGQTSLGSLLQNTARTVSVALNNGIPVTGPDFSPSAAIAPFYNSGPASVSGISSAAFTGAAGTSSTPIDVKTGLPQGINTGLVPQTGLPSSVLSNQSGAPITVQINMNGATVYGQQGADMLMNAATNAFRTNAGLKLF